MNVERLINMILRQLMRKGMNKGIEMASGRGKRPEDMTPEERAEAQATAQNVRRVQKHVRTARRFMK